MSLPPASVDSMTTMNEIKYRAYITVVEADECTAFRVTFDGAELPAVSGKPWSMFTSFDRAANRVTDYAVDLVDGIVPGEPAVSVRWIPQFNSFYGEMANEPCGFVGDVTITML